MRDDKFKNVFQNHIRKLGGQVTSTLTSQTTHIVVNQTFAHQVTKSFKEWAASDIMDIVAAEFAVGISKSQKKGSTVDPNNHAFRQLSFYIDREEVELLAAALFVVRFRDVALLNLEEFVDVICKLMTFNFDSHRQHGLKCESIMENFVFSVLSPQQPRAKYHIFDKKLAHEYRDQPLPQWDKVTYYKKYFVADVPKYHQLVPIGICQVIRSEEYKQANNKFEYFEKEYEKNLSKIRKKKIETVFYEQKPKSTWCQICNKKFDNYEKHVSSYYHKSHIKNEVLYEEIDQYFDEWFNEDDNKSPEKTQNHSFMFENLNITSSSKIMDQSVSEASQQSLHPDLQLKLNSMVSNNMEKIDQMDRLVKMRKVGYHVGDMQRQAKSAKLEKENMDILNSVSKQQRKIDEEDEEDELWEKLSKKRAPKRKFV